MWPSGPQRRCLWAKLPEHYAIKHPASAACRHVYLSTGKRRQASPYLHVCAGPLLDDKEKQRCAALMQYRGQVRDPVAVFCHAGTPPGTRDARTCTHTIPHAAIKARFNAISLCTCLHDCVACRSLQSQQTRWQRRQYSVAHASLLASVRSYKSSLTASCKKLRSAARFYGTWREQGNSAGRCATR